MKGYVIAMQVDGADIRVYWDGTTPVNDVDQSLFIEDLATARQTAGNLQTSYTDRDVDVLAATKGVQIIGSPPPPPAPVG